MASVAALPEARPAVRVKAPRAGVEYSSVSAGDKLMHSMTGTRFSERHEVRYVIGSGEHARGYLVERGGSLFLSPLSYYKDVRKWDLSPGYANGHFRDFTRPAAAACVFCHTGSSKMEALAISCENCHGPGETHAAQMKGGRAGAASIVNPAKLPPSLRDEVCFQCHLAGDIRILRTGKTESDFRPGSALEEVVSIFSLPAAAKPGGLQVVGQPAQLAGSKCWKSSNGALGCITCHSPHPQARATPVRSRCLNCHATRGCKAPAVRRQKTAPPDDCVACHMPKSELNTIPHTSHTNHQIPRTPQDEVEMLFSQESSFVRPELIRETRLAVEDPRSEALAYAEAASRMPVFSAKALRLLSSVAGSLPNDGPVQAAYAAMLRVTQPERGDEAERAYRRALGQGIRSFEVLDGLARLRLAAGDREAAMKLYEEAILAEPYAAAGYFRLAALRSESGDAADAAKLLDKVRQFDPGHPDLEKQPPQQ